jgi:hypothetical protein
MSCIVVTVSCRQIWLALSPRKPLQEATQLPGRISA